MSDMNSFPASPARGRGRGRGRGGSTRGNHSRAAVKKPTTGGGRRGRQKLYGAPRLQGTFERGKELKNAYASVVNAIRPAIEELADRNIDALKEDPDAYKCVEAFLGVKEALDTRVADVKKVINTERDIRLTFIKSRRDASVEIIEDSFKRKLEEMQEDRLDELLAQLDRLETLHDQGLPVDLHDDHYEHRTLEPGRKLASHVIYTQDGIEVPCHKTEPQLNEYTQHLKAPKTPAKRKAEGEAEGQPTPKRPASAMDDGGTASLAPRHIGGLLSAVAPPDEDAGERAEESRVPSPTPGAANLEGSSESGSPREAEQQDTSAPADTVLPDDDRIPALPNGTSDPDPYGVRIITKRRMANSENNNRIVIQPLYEWEPHEIGFRDSTNDKSRGATKAKRGKYLNTPNSNYWYIDRSVWQYDSTSHEKGDLDQELVEKHGLHPTLGLFLEGSRNVSEDPLPFVSGKQPVIFTTEDGQIKETSRSMRIMELQAELDRNQRKRKLKAGLSAFTQQEGIDAETVMPDPAVVEQFRQTRLEGYVGKPAPESPLEEVTEDEVEEPDAHASFASILEAAQEVDAQEKKAATPSVKPAPPATRPFDPIRDIFAATEEVAPAPPVDRSNIIFLLEVATSDASVGEPGRKYLPTDYIVGEESFERGGPSPEPMSGSTQGLPSFLQTALNPPAASYPPPSPSQAYANAVDPALQQRGPDMPASRVPFSNPGQARGVAPPGLPPLRPARGAKQFVEEPSPEPSYGSPRQSLVVTNSGNYYPPAPARPFHSGYTLQEQPQNALPPPQYIQDPSGQHGLPPLPPPPPHGHGPPGPPPIQPMPMPPQQPVNSGPYAMSPPYPGTAQLSLTHGQMMDSPPRPESLHGLPPPGSTPPRTSISGPASAQSAAAAAARYRKLEPAPIPAHRQGWVSSGPELRTVPYDYREGIKDYSAVEPPPGSGPTHIRGWAHNNVKRPRASSKNEASPKGGPEESNDSEQAEEAPSPPKKRRINIKVTQGGKVLTPSRPQIQPTEEQKSTPEAEEGKAQAVETPKAEEPAEQKGIAPRITIWNRETKKLVIDAEGFEETPQRHPRYRLRKRKGSPAV